MRALLPLKERTFEKDFEPTGDFVMLRMHAQLASAGGIHLPDGASPDPRRATVVKVGEEEYVVVTASAIVGKSKSGTVANGSNGAAVSS